MGVRETFPFALAISTMFFALAAMMMMMMISPSCASQQQRVLLRDLSVVTLQRGGITQGRRSAGVPQLTCVGGTAKKYDSYWPDTVQCINRGFDGYDVQWECKADMDNDVKFGQIRMSCEGYDYPDDPYVLRGSCGLEYHLEFTKEGLRKRGSGDSGSWFGGSSDYSSSSSWNRASSQSHASRSSERETESSFSSIFVLLIFGIAIYVLYACFISPATTTADGSGAVPGGPPPYEEHERHSRYPPTNSGSTTSSSATHGPRVYPDLGNDGANDRDNAAPPPPGWNFDNNARRRGPNVHGFSGSTSSGGDYGSRTYTTTEQQQQQQQQQQQNQNQNQGFSWGTLLTGGFLGYLFGSGTNRHDRYTHRGGWGSGWGGGWGNQHHNTGGSWWGTGNRGGGWGGGGWGSNRGYSFGGGGGTSHSSSGSRTASGFGGTSRR